MKRHDTAWLEADATPVQQSQAHVFRLMEAGMKDGIMPEYMLEVRRVGRKCGSRTCRLLECTVHYQVHLMVGFDNQQLRCGQQHMRTQPGSIHICYMRGLHLRMVWCKQVCSCKAGAGLQPPSTLQHQRRTEAGQTLHLLLLCPAVPEAAHREGR